MGRIGLAFRAFFAAFGNAATAERLQSALLGETLPKATTGEKPKPTPLPETPPKRSEAITLLAALQREARLVDLIQQPLGQFTDEQIGSAARNVLTDAAGALSRFFALQPVCTQEEDATIDVPKGYDPAMFKLTGAVEGSGPLRGKLVHKGWQATTCNLPTWTGSKEAALVVAPAEVEV
ncbi:MAG: DUF2760 domain-containing protein [Pirellulaceae bacterium]|nr:DUF2760 domain-containing protein [Pirellulaceae bacterium]